jgi:hypothetical protein
MGIPIAPYSVALIIVLAAMMPGAVHAENWPQFRGARAGVAPDDPKLPET